MVEGQPGRAGRVTLAQQPQQLAAEQGVALARRGVGDGVVGCRGQQVAAARPGGGIGITLPAVGCRVRQAGEAAVEHDHGAGRQLRENVPDSLVGDGPGDPVASEAGMRGQVQPIPGPEQAVPREVEQDDAARLRGRGLHRVEHGAFVDGIDDRVDVRGRHAAHLFQRPPQILDRGCHRRQIRQT